MAKYKKAANTFGAPVYIQSTSYLEIQETTDPGAPSANTCRLYVRDNGAGKTQLVAVFPTGVVQQVAIEP